MTNIIPKSEIYQRCPCRIVYILVYICSIINHNKHPKTMTTQTSKAEILAELAKEIMEQAMENDELTPTIDRDALLNDDPNLYIYAEVTVDMHREIEPDPIPHTYNVVDEITIERLFLYADSEEWDLDQTAFLSNLKYFANLK